MVVKTGQIAQIGKGVSQLVVKIRQVKHVITSCKNNIFVFKWKAWGKRMGWWFTVILEPLNNGGCINTEGLTAKANDVQRFNGNI